MALMLVRQPPQRLHRRIQQACCFAGLRACHPKALHLQPLSCPVSGRQSCAALHGAVARPALPSSRSRRRSSGIVYAAWGDDIKWSKAKIVDTSLAAQGLQRLVLDIGQAADSHSKPGQFLQLRVGDSNPGFYAIATPPDPNNQGVVELLIKNDGQTSQLLCSQAAGAEVDTSPVQGKGFPVEKVPVDKFPTIIIFATGSGISPIRALIESDALETDKRKEVRLYYGTFNEDRTAYRDLIQQWQAANITVRQVFSDDGGGYIQDVFEKDGLADGSQACAFLVGQKEMCLAVTDLLVSKGVDKDKILLNF